MVVEIPETSDLGTGRPTEHCPLLQHIIHGDHVVKVFEHQCYAIEESPCSTLQQRDRLYAQVRVCPPAHTPRMMSRACIVMTRKGCSRGPTGCDRSCEPTCEDGSTLGLSITATH